MDLPIRHQRAEGGVALRFAHGARGTALRDLHQAAPLRLLFPDPEPGEAPIAALVNTAGGLAGGDAVGIEVALEAGARATLASAAAEKIYRSLGPETRVAARLALGDGAALEWIPQETILFDGARLSRRIEADLAPGAVLLAAESLVFGRTARGEVLRHGLVRDLWRIRRGGRLLWADGLALEGDIGAHLAAPFGFAGAEAMATLLLAEDGAEARLEALRAVAGVATVPRPGLLLARWLGRATEVRAGVARAIVALRSQALGLPARLPRLWTT